MVLWSKIPDDEGETTLKVELLTVKLDEPFCQGALSDISHWKVAFH